MIAVRCEDELMRREERNFALLRGIIVGINGEHMRGAVCRNNVVDNNLKLTRERAHRGLRMDVGNCRKHTVRQLGQVGVQNDIQKERTQCQSRSGPCEYIL